MLQMQGRGFPSLYTLLSPQHGIAYIQLSSFASLGELDTLNFQLTVRLFIQLGAACHVRARTRRRRMCAKVSPTPYILYCRV